MDWMIESLRFGVYKRYRDRSLTVDKFSEVKWV